MPNSKYEGRNTKQIPKSKFKFAVPHSRAIATGALFFRIWSFRHSNLFRISSFEFWISQGVRIASRSRQALACPAYHDPRAARYIVALSFAPTDSCAIATEEFSHGSRTHRSREPDSPADPAPARQSLTLILARKKSPRSKCAWRRRISGRTRNAHNRPSGN